MRFLPLFLDLDSGTVALVGSGAAALSKLQLLRSAGADVRWYSGNLDVAEDVVLASASAGRLELSFADPLEADFSEFAAIVVAAGGDLGERVAARARAANVAVNVVDRPDLSTFIFPAVVDRGDVVVAIGTGGASPVLARRLRERIEAMLPARIGELAALMNRYRARFAAMRHKSTSPRKFWERVLDGPIAQLLLAGRARAAEAALARAINESALPQQQESGTVYLVGAGPGDPDLLTLRALQVLQGADIVFYDELVTPGVLDRARRDAERVFVGKRREHPGIGQDEINRRLVEAARSGPAFDLSQRGIAARLRHRPSGGRSRRDRLVRARRSADDRGLLYGARRGGARARWPHRGRSQPGDAGRRARPWDPPRFEGRRWSPGGFAVACGASWRWAGAARRRRRGRALRRLA